MFRKILFWSHLVAGLISGIAIGIMCFTGTALAFQKQLTAWSERDARVIAAPAPGATPLSIEELQAKLRAAQPDVRPASVVIQNDPEAAIAFPAGRANYYLNPYTGEVRQTTATKMASFMTSMTAWHRYLGFSGQVSRPRGKLINGVCNIAFCVLAITGLYLWMPRHWSVRGVKAVAIFNWRLAGKARDFNWHNSIGLWSAPILIVLTLTAIPISFQWGTRVINSLTGTTPAVPGMPPGPGPAAAVVVAPPPAGALPLSQDALVASVKKELPRWETITLNGARGGGPGRGGPGAPGGRGRGPGGPPAEATPASANPVSAPAAAPAIAAIAAPTAGPVSFTVRSGDTWPRSSNIMLTLNPYTGEILRRTGYADQPAAQRVRAWTRYLHTGEALGFWGQLVAGLACLGGCFLVYTGFALSWRRFFRRSG